MILNNNIVNQEFTGYRATDGRRIIEGDVVLYEDSENAFYDKSSKFVGLVRFLPHFRDFFIVPLSNPNGPFRQAIGNIHLGFNKITVLGSVYDRPQKDYSLLEQECRLHNENLKRFFCAAHIPMQS